MKKIKIVAIIVIILVIAGLCFWIFGGRNIEISSNNEQPEPKDETGINPITGQECEDYNRRPIAVMMANDAINRPLSGISQADVVIEMPVITGGVTRLMAIYGCETPEQIGSVRSARHDYIPLALGFDAIYAHWGGSHFAYDQLNKRIIENIDAMTDQYQAYYRTSDKEPPYNGFTSLERLINAAKKFKYSLENKFIGYPHLKNPKSKLVSPNTGGKLTIGYGGEFRVSYLYNKEENVYQRFRTNLRETDKNNGNQAEVSVVAVMRAESHMIEVPNYNEVDVQGEGEAKIYQNGEEIKGIWKKTGNYSDSKLTFINQDGNEIEFTPGKIWIQVVEPNTEVKWEVF
ncbi:MAG: DUF3048 domain-containing protein [Patescibacteria group bacterium]